MVVRIDVRPKNKLKQDNNMNGDFPGVHIVAFPLRVQATFIGFIIFYLAFFFS
jgi:hypothetical protein